MAAMTELKHQWPKHSNTHFCSMALLNNSTYYAYRGSATQPPVQNLDTLDAFCLNKKTTIFPTELQKKMLPVQDTGTVTTAEKTF